MPTMAKAIRAYIESVGGIVTPEQIKRHINDEYPNQWKATTLQAHLYACAVNNPKAYIHHPSTEKFLYRHSDGTFELYSEDVHGPNEWAPSEAADEVTEFVELADTSIGLERDLEDHLVHHLDGIEKGLKFVARQVSTDVGRIDILAEDAGGNRVILEVKVGDAKDSSVGQIARYMGWYAKADGKAARAFLIATHFPEGVQYAAAAIPNLRLVTYRVHFSFDPVEI
ncbi:MAG TPA: endonuclease NucS domain-containing protein [Longimicrobium sp.]|nr:endonuclease NucS domain-containing protein [Longimicrobium sp.]